MTAPRPSHTRTASTSSVPDHRPLNPSGLRQELTPSSRDSSSASLVAQVTSSPVFEPEREDRPFRRFSSGSTPSTSGPGPSAVFAHGQPLQTQSQPLLHGEPPSSPPTETSPLIRRPLHREDIHPGPCLHGTFSPRPSSPASLFSGVSGISGASGPGGSTDDGDTDGEGSGRAFPGTEGLMRGWAGAEERTADWRRRIARKMRSKKMSTSSALAEQAGFRDNATMYIAYYVPCVAWMRHYSFSYLKGDLIAALTMASMYLPMALSLASNLAHVPPINGLYSFVFNPFMYALLGSCPQMVVGPEAAGSLLVGTVVKRSIELGRGEDEDEIMQARVAGVVSGMAGATVFAAGLARLGFLDSVLSRPFLRGFISAIGVVIAVEQLIPELGLTRYTHGTGVSHGSAVDKLKFLVQNLGNVHVLTFAISAISFGSIMVFRELKKRLQPRFPWVAYIPDRFLVVVLSAVLSWRLDWASSGVDILGPVKSASGGLFNYRWPFRLSHMKHIQDAMSTSFLIALLGFFESSVAAKSLASEEAIGGIQLSANRELVALGAANLVGACFMSLPAFGGYGRSKVNKSTGGKSPMSSIFLSLITLTCILFLLPYFFYLPKPVLCSMISVVAWSLIEEAPADILFFVRIRSWTELSLMAVIFLSTMFYSLSLGMALGIGLSVLRVIHHSTRSRIQILGRIPGTHRFENAELNPHRLEFIEGCLIVKIPEPLTFANTGSLRSRLSRLERYGTGDAHPALPRLRREDSNRNIIFDIHGVTSMDGAGTQVLEDIVRGYVNKGVRVFFSRGPEPGDDGSEVWRLMEMAGIVDLVGGRGHFVGDVQEALKMTEWEDSVQEGMGAVGC